MSTFKCSNLSKSYSNTFSMKNISFQLSKNECLGILGDNGSGKSTLLSMLAGMQIPDSGEIYYDSMPITKKQRNKISYVPQSPILIEELSVKDNLKLWCGIYNINHFRKTKDILLELPPVLNLESMFNKKVNTLSGGMKKKVSIAISLINKPDFIIMDEAFAALDMKTIDSLLQYLKYELSVGIIYSSHNIYEILELCDRILILKQGEISYYSNEKEVFDDNSKQWIYSNF